MANFAGTYASNRSYYPYFDYVISASEKARDASSVTYSIGCTVKLVSSGYYGFDMYFNYNIGGVTGKQLLKSTTGGFPSSTSTFTVKVNTNASGGTNTISAQAWSSSTNDGEHWQNSFNTGTKYLDKSTFNTPPVINSIQVLNSGVRWENETKVDVLCKITDVDRNLSEVVLERLVNGMTNTEFRFTSGWSLSGNTYELPYPDSGIGGVPEGHTVSYRVTARDSYNAWTGWTNSSTSIVKNVMTPANLSVQNLGVGWGSPSIVFNYSGASNSNGNTEFMYHFENDYGLPIYNNQERSSYSTNQIDIEGWGQTSSDRPYIKSLDLIDFVRKSQNRTQSFTLRLVTKNKAGTAKYSQVTLTIRLQPNPQGGEITSLDGEVDVSGGKYFVPQLGGAYILKWNSGNDLTGGYGLVYDIQASYGGGEFYYVATSIMDLEYDITQDVNKYTVTKPIDYKVRVVVRTEYGTQTISQEKVITLHYWNPPSVFISDLDRKNLQWSAVVSAYVNSSISKIKSISWSGNQVVDSTEGVEISNDHLSATGKIGQVEVSANSSFDIVVKVSDDSGVDNSQTAVSIRVPRYQPIIAMREFGLGVNAFADAQYKLKVGGNVEFQGYLNALEPQNTAPNKLKGLCSALVTDTSLDGSPGNKCIVQNFGTEDYGAQLCWDYSETNQFKVRSLNSNNKVWGDWAGLYTTKNKPSPEDIGAAPSSHSHSYLPLSGGAMNSGAAISWVSPGDSARIYNELSGDATSLCLETADDGNQDCVRVRNYHWQEGGKDVAVFARTYMDFNATPYIKAENIIFPDSSSWKSVDVFRYGCKARYGIGSDGDGADRNYACIETWNRGASGFMSRLEVGAGRLRYMKNVNGNPAFNCWVDIGEHGGIAIGSSSSGYVKWLRSHTDVQFRNYADNAYTRACGSAWVNSSKRAYKTNLSELSADTAFDILMTNEIKQYNYKQEIQVLNEIEKEARQKGYVLEREMLTPDQKLGLILEELTPEAEALLHPQRTEGIDLYCMTSLLWKICQEQQKELDALVCYVKRLGFSSFI